jgi:hypothetical protein
VFAPGQDITRPLKRPGKRLYRADGLWLVSADASDPDHLRRSRPRPHPSTERPCSGRVHAPTGTRIARRPDRPPGNGRPAASADGWPTPSIPALPAHAAPDSSGPAMVGGTWKRDPLIRSTIAGRGLHAARHASHEARRDRTSCRRGVAGSGPRARFALPQGRRSSQGKLARRAPVRRCKADLGWLARRRPRSSASAPTLRRRDRTPNDRLQRKGTLAWESPREHRAPARRQRRTGATDSPVEQSPEVAGTAQTALGSTPHGEHSERQKGPRPTARGHRPW